MYRERRVIDSLSPTCPHEHVKLFVAMSGPIPPEWQAPFEVRIDGIARSEDLAAKWAWVIHVYQCGSFTPLIFRIFPCPEPV